MTETATPTRTDEVRASQECDTPIKEPTNGAIPPTAEESAIIDDLRKRMEHRQIDQSWVDTTLAEVEGVLVAGRMVEEDEKGRARAKAMQAINDLLSNAPDGYVLHLRDKLDGAEECDPTESTERNAAIEELRARLRNSNFGTSAVKNITRGLGFLVEGEKPLNTPEPEEPDCDTQAEGHTPKPEWSEPDWEAMADEVLGDQTKRLQARLCNIFMSGWDGGSEPPDYLVETLWLTPTEAEQVVRGFLEVLHPFKGHRALDLADETPKAA